MAKPSCKKVGLKEDKEVSDACWPQTDEGPSTKLKRDLKYDFLQLMIKPKTVYKYAQNTMQDKAKKRAITQSIKKNASNSKRHLMKYEEGLKIRPFIVRNRVQK